MLTVYTLGRFCVTDGKQSLDEDEIHSAKLCNLLTYLMMHRNRTLTMDEIAAALWQEEETKNPAGALKNLMYRLRKLLKETFGDIEFIKTSADAYCWNPQIKLWIDAKQIENLWSLIRKDKHPGQERNTFLTQVVNLYQGSFMPQISEIHWVFVSDAYYRSIYHSAVILLAEQYQTEKQYEEMEHLCEKALQYEPEEEEIYYELILARYYQGKIKLAWKTYEDACRILKDEVGVADPKKLKLAYKELLNARKGREADDIEAIEHGMAEKKTGGVFWCGYSVFREIYRFETRKRKNGGEMEQMLLLTVRPGDKKEPDWDTIDEYRVRKAMDHLESSLQKVLKSGDAVSRYSDSQYVILLPQRSKEAGRNVAGKIIDHYYDEHPGDQNISICADLKDVK